MEIMESPYGHHPKGLERLMDLTSSFSGGMEVIRSAKRRKKSQRTWKDSEDLTMFLN